MSELTITEFLLARISEREDRLNYIPEPETVVNSHGHVSARGEDWKEIDDCDLCGQHFFDGSESVVKDSWWQHREEVHERSFVIAECEAKWRIVEEHGDGRSPTAIYSEPYCRTCSDDTVVTLPCRTLKALAQPYADHADFDPKWVL